jgi:hypothetical protein
MDHKKEISKRKFSIEDQWMFANLTGDANPIHVDQIIARRTLYGECVVHGMHALLWSLEVLAEHVGTLASGLNVRFSKPIFLDIEIYCYWDESAKKLTLLQDGTTRMILEIDFGRHVHRSTKSLISKKSRLSSLSPSISECSEYEGIEFGVYGNQQLAVDSFPLVCRYYGVMVVLEIGGLSQVVGMECPGLHSLFASLQLTLGECAVYPVYSVTKTDERVGLINISVASRTFSAFLECFFRPKAIARVDMAMLEKLVIKDEFSAVNALIIGGSRGLGESVAKLLSLGGAQCTITYNVGKSDAEEVQSEINSFNGNCSVERLNLGNLNQALLINSKFNQVYYFASPKINIESDLGGSKLHASYREFYVTQFEAICTQLDSHTHISVFYPSTIYIESNPVGFMRYIESKLEGEDLCRKISRAGSLRVRYPRLPPLVTDQNQSIVQRGLDASVNASVLLPYVREMMNI